MLSLIIYFLSGAFLWTLLEYFLHRFLGHWKKGRNPFTKEHLRHHRETHYFASAYKKAIAAISVVSILAGLLGFIVGLIEGAAFSAGLGMMYMAYEAIHKRAHTHAPVGAYGGWLRKHHFYHHFKDPRKNHGVTSPLWDIVFGTNVMPGVLMVPRKLALDWLIDKNTGEILPQFSGDYRLYEGSAAGL